MPSCSTILGKLGELWHRRGQHDRAIAAFTQMIAQMPGDFRGYGARAGTYQQMNQFEKALADWDAAIRLFPEIQAYSMRGMVHLHLQRYEEALRDFNTHLVQNPADMQAMLKRAVVYSKQGKHALSLKDRLHVYEQMPDHPLAINMLAWILATAPDSSLRDGKRALELAQQCCEMTQWRDSNIIDTLAAACAEAGMFDKAVRYQTQAIQIAIEAPADIQQQRKDRLKLYQSGQPYRDDVAK